MSFPDPISITINAVANSLPRVQTLVANGPSTWSNADESLKVEISHLAAKKNRERHLCKLTQKAIAANPLVPAEFIENYTSVYMVVDNPKTGFTDANIQYLTSGLLAFLATVANRDRLINGEA